MSEKLLPRLSTDVKALLTEQGEHRLTEDQFLKLSLQFQLLCSWADRVPEKIHFFFVDWPPILILERSLEFTREQLGIAAFLQPLHSQLCAIAVQVLWKADQLVRALSTAFNAGDLVVAATMARSLMETAAAFGSESYAMSELWKARKGEAAPDLDSLVQFDQEAMKIVGQILFGTKLKQEKEPETGIERTNVLTLIDKAAKLSENTWVRRYYEILCDTVHPSIGSNRCFWTREPVAWEEGGPMSTFTASRHSPGLLGDLPFTIGMGALWAAQWLGLMWCLDERTRNDLCLTAKIYALPEGYYGVVRPGDPSGYCRCGSAEPEETCNHEFGRR